MSRRSIPLPVAAICALILAAPALAASGHATYYKIKGGTLNFNVSAKSTLSNDYGIEISDNASGGGGNVLGNFSLKKGAYVYESSKAMTADAKKLAGDHHRVRHARPQRQQGRHDHGEDRPPRPHGRQDEFVPDRPRLRIFERSGHHRRQGRSTASSTSAAAR